MNEIQDVVHGLQFIYSENGVKQLLQIKSLLFVP